MNSNARRLTSSVLVQVAGRLASMAIGFVSLGLLARHLGPEGYGELAAAAALLGLMMVFADFGVSSIVLRDANAPGGELGPVLRQSLGLRLAASPMLALLLVAVATLSFSAEEFPLLRASLPAYVIGLLAAGVGNSLRAAYQHELRMTWTATAELVAAVTSLVAYYLIIAYGLPVLLLFYVQGLYPLIMLLVLYAGLRLRHDLRPSLDRRRSLRLLRDSAPVGLAMLVAAAYLRADILMLGILAPQAELGNYGFAYRIIAALAVVSVYIGNTLFPVLAARERDALAFRIAFTKGLIAVASIAFPLAVGAALLARETVVLIGGAEYLGAVQPLVVLELTLILVFVNGLIGSALIIFGASRRFLLMSVSCLVLNVALNLVLIPALGGLGAAIATSISELLTTTVAGYWLRQYVSRPQLLRGLVAVSAGTVVMAVFVSAAREAIPLLILVVSAGGLYVAVTLLARLHATLGLSVNVKR